MAGADGACDRLGCCHQGYWPQGRGCYLGKSQDRETARCCCDAEARGTQEGDQETEERRRWSGPLGESNRPVKRLPSHGAVSGLCGGKGGGRCTGPVWWEGGNDVGSRERRMGEAVGMHEP